MLARPDRWRCGNRGGNLSPMKPNMNSNVSPVRAAREAAGMTREQLAVRAGIAGSTLYLAENGLISISTARKLAGVLGCDPATLLGKGHVQ